MNDPLFPKKYEDTINFRILILFILILLLSFFILFIVDDTTKNYETIVSFCVILLGASVSGILTVIFAGFFKSIGVFKNTNTYLGGAAAVFIIFTTFTGYSYSMLSENLKTFNYEEKLKENSERLANKLTEERINDYVNNNEKYFNIVNKEMLEQNSILKANIETLERKLANDSTSIVEHIEKIINSNSLKTLKVMTKCNKVLLSNIEYKSPNKTSKGKHDPWVSLKTDNNDEEFLTAKITPKGSDSLIYTLEYEISKNLIVLDIIDSKRMNTLCPSNSSHLTTIPDSIGPGIEED